MSITFAWDYKLIKISFLFSFMLKIRITGHVSIYCDTRSIKCTQILNLSFILSSFLFVYSFILFFSFISFYSFIFLFILSSFIFFSFFFFHLSSLFLSSISILSSFMSLFVHLSFYSFIFLFILFIFLILYLVFFHLLFVPSSIKIMHMSCLSVAYLFICCLSVCLSWRVPSDSPLILFLFPSISLFSFLSSSLLFSSFLSLPITSVCLSSPSS